VSILPCNLNPVALRVVVDGYWNLGALRDHVGGCRWCTAVYRATAAAMGSKGGLAGRGSAKRRGSSAYYRALAGRRLSAPRTPQ
jgi:hypothetical protein